MNFCPSQRLALSQDLKTVVNSVAGLTDCNYFLTKQIACHEIVLVELTTLNRIRYAGNTSRRLSRNATCTPVSLSMLAMLGNTNLWHVILGCCAYRLHIYTRTCINTCVNTHTCTRTEDRKAESVPLCRYVTWTTVHVHVWNEAFNLSRQSTQTLVTNTRRDFVTGRN